MNVHIKTNQKINHRWKFHQGNGRISLRKITQVKMEKNQVIVTNAARTRDVEDGAKQGRESQSTHAVFGEFHHVLLHQPTFNGHLLCG